MLHPLAVDTRSVLPIRWLSTLAAVAALVVVTSAVADSPRLAGRVVGISDGDTVHVRLQSGMIRVRLHGIDAPEHDQAYGKAAKRELSQLVYRRRTSSSSPSSRTATTGSWRGCGSTASM